MKIAKRFTTLDSFASLPELPELSETEAQTLTSILQTNLLLKPGERATIITDPSLLTAASFWFTTATQLGAQCQMMLLERLTHSGQQPPKEVIELAENSDVVILQTLHSLTHTAASKQAAASGARVASLPRVTHELMMRTLSIDYEPIRSLGTQLQDALSQGSELRITSEHGTDLTLQIRQNNIIDDNGFFSRGSIGNLPAGEVFFAPIENSTSGTWVINGSIADGTLDKPVVLTIKQGKVNSISGGQAAHQLESLLSKVGPAAFEVAEIGIGTNPAANPFGLLIEAEKAYGTAHLAVGNNVGFGGWNTSPIHIDGLTLAPTIAIDNQVILENNTFLL